MYIKHLSVRSLTSIGSSISECKSQVFKQYFTILEIAWLYIWCGVMK